MLTGNAQRIAVAGSPGSGKTTLAGKLANRLGLTFIELDGLYHGPNWVPRETFEEDVRKVVAQEQWATEWQYSLARPLLLARATAVVWLDLPNYVVVGRVWRRTFKRWATRQELWNGNREPGLGVLLSRSNNSMLWWGWTNKDRYRDLPIQLERMAAQHGIDPKRVQDLVVVHLRTRKEVNHWLQLQDFSMPHSA